MSFQQSCEHIHLVEGGESLVAQCHRVDGSWRTSSLHLDTMLGNDNGQFRLGWQNFSKSARRIRLDGTVLSAELRCADERTWSNSKVDLHDYITNEDGVLKAVGLPSVIAVPHGKHQDILHQIGDAFKSKDAVVLASEDRHGAATYHVQDSKHGAGWVFKAHTPDAVASVLKLLKSATCVVKKVNIHELQTKAGPNHHNYVAANPNFNHVHIDQVSNLNLKHGHSSAVNIPSAHGAHDLAHCHFSVGLHVDVHFDDEAVLKAGVSLLQELSAKRGQIATLESKLKEANGEAANGLAKIESLEKELSVKLQDLRAVEVRLSTSNNAITILNGDMKSKASKIADMEKTIASKDLALTEARHYVTEVMRELEEARALTIRKEEDSATLTAKLGDCMLKLESRDAALATSQVDISSLRLELANKEAAAAEAEKIGAAKQAASGLLQASLEAELMTCNFTITSLRGEIKQKETTIGEMEGSIVAVEMELNNFRRQVAEVARELEEAHTVINSKKSEIATLESELAVSVQEVAKRDAVLAASHSDIVSLRSELADKDAAAVEARKLVAANQASSNALRTSLEAKLVASNNTITSLSGEMKLKDTKIIEMDASLVALEGAFQESRSHVADVARKLEVAHALNNSKNAEIVALEAKLAASLREVEKRDATIAASKSRMDCLTSDLALKDAKVAEAEKIAAAKDATSKAMQASLDALHKRHDELDVNLQYSWFRSLVSSFYVVPVAFFGWAWLICRGFRRAESVTLT